MNSIKYSNRCVYQLAHADLKAVMAFHTNFCLDIYLVLNMINSDSCGFDCLKKMGP